MTNLSDLFWKGSLEGIVSAVLKLGAAKRCTTKINNICNSKLIVVTILNCLLENSRVLQIYLTNEWLYSNPDHPVFPWSLVILSCSPAIWSCSPVIFSLGSDHASLLPNWLAKRLAAGSSRVPAAAFRPPIWSFRDTIAVAIAATKCILSHLSRLALYRGG